MTDADEALLWAREDLAKKFEPFKPYISETIRNGAWDNDAAMRASVIGYRAGAAASADRIKELETRVRKLEWVLRGMIAAASNNLPDRSKQHNLEVALEVLKEPDL